jgi:S-ribosylhomocysteine lyase LuxS involved in autoinducer biosynthesis
LENRLPQRIVLGLPHARCINKFKQTNKHKSKTRTKATCGDLDLTLDLRICTQNNLWMQNVFIHSFIHSLIQPIKHELGTAVCTDLVPGCAGDITLLNHSLVT